MKRFIPTTNVDVPAASLPHFASTLAGRHRLEGDLLAELNSDNPSTCDCFRDLEPSSEHSFTTLLTRLVIENGKRSIYAAFATAEDQHGPQWQLELGPDPQPPFVLSPVGDTAVGPIVVCPR